MKILLYSDCFIFGGSENIIENLLKSEELNRKDQFVFYYAYNKRYQEAVDKKFPGYKNIHPLAILSAFSKWGYGVQLNRKSFSIYSSYIKLRYTLSRLLEKAGLYDAYNYFKLYRIFKQQAPHILYINNGGYPGAQSCRLAVLSAKRAGIKNIIFNVNNLALPQKGIIDNWLDKKINSFVKVFVTASKAAAAQLIKQRKFAISKCMNIPNTVLKQTEDRAQTDAYCLRRKFKIADGERVLGAAGLLTPRKGFHVLIDAVNLLVKKEKMSFRLIIFGEGEQRAYLENKIVDYKLEDTILLPGHEKDLLPYMKELDIFVCPSIANEDFPYVILEAMLLGKPVIGTDIAGIPEQIINNYNGLIIPPNNHEMLAGAIGKLLASKELITTMGKHSLKRYAENFTNKNIMQRYQQLFGLLANN